MLFFRVTQVPDAFGRASSIRLQNSWDLVREWGRIGSPGTLRIDPFETLEESERAFRRIEKQKRKRRYIRSNLFVLFRGVERKNPSCTPEDESAL